jgi:hypothetical protein
MGLVRITTLVGFALAAYNLDRIRSFKAKHCLDDAAQVVERPRQQRARRRSGTWTDIVEGGPGPRAT